MDYLLGLDLGPTSVGWAVFELGGNGPTGIAECGSRIFAAGVAGSLLEIQEGKDASKNVSRREARQARRRLERRARRKLNIAHQLSRAGLLPPADWLDPSERDKAIKALDLELSEKYQAEGGEARVEILPYYLRARALDHRLEAHELGRALYHLGQRRGFLSNRKAPSQDDKEEGQVYEGIEELREGMRAAKARTLGEYFAGLDPHETRIRERWTARSMYEDEFEQILGAQRVHHPDLLTGEMKERLHKAMFHQRPLKSQKGLIGKCELEEGERRMALSRLMAQKFRILQRVNDLRIVYEDLTERPLTPEERDLVTTALMREEKLTWAGLRKLLKPFEKLSREDKFNFEMGGEKGGLKGNVTAGRIRKVIADRWDGLSAEEQEAMVEDLRSMVSEEALRKRGAIHWGLDEETAKAFSRIRLEDGYLNLSAKAAGKLLPLMEGGMAFATAKKAVYPDLQGRYLVCDLLPPVGQAPFELRNPAVERVLVELRKVVNGVIRKHGKPNHIRIELARDLKKSRKDRKEIAKRNWENRKTRDRAKENILRETGNSQPSGRDVLLAVLHEECGGTCPYTGRTITLANLLGGSSQFDIEHIIPYHRCFDDSFNNKTLCLNEENRQVKRHRTPFEAYSGDRYDEIIERVKRFNGSSRNAKLRRFLMKDLKDLDEFTNRHLSDTRYAARLAADYLALLYGGRYDAGGTLRIEPTTGQITSDLRRAWKLNDILGGDGEKSRDDHRHHAIDAIATGLTTRGTLMALSKANEKGGWERRRQWWKDVPPPWPNFLEEAREKVRGIVVSHRPQRRVSGALHQETLYSPPKEGPGGNSVAHVRRELSKLKKTEVDKIVDEKTRERVQQRLAELGETDPSKAFAERANHPWFETKDGKRHIHKVRIRVSAKTFPVGQGPTERHVLASSNHHMAIFEVTDKKGKVRWRDRVVDLYTASQRLKNRQPVVNREWDGPGEGRFLFTLSFGDTVLMRPREEFEEREVLLVRGVTGGRLALCRVTDSRLKADIMSAGDWFWPVPDGLRKLGCQKVEVTPLGEIRYAHD